MKPFGFLRLAFDGAAAAEAPAGAGWAESDEANGAVAASAAVERRNERRFMGGGGEERKLEMTKAGAARGRNRNLYSRSRSSITNICRVLSGAMPGTTRASPVRFQHGAGSRRRSPEFHGPMKTGGARKVRPVWRSRKV